jgi:hypothetical protein
VTAMWAIVGCLATVGIYMLGWTRGRTHGIAEAGQWEALVDCQDAELRAKDAELARADAAIERLTTNVEVLSGNVIAAYKSGQVDGQMFQAERKEHGL